MNMMKYCPECYKELPPNASTCPYCGYKTGNGDESEEAPGFLKTPQTDSYLPPEQTVLSFLLLSILFWGLNIAITTLPIFLGVGTVRNIIIAGAGSQIITRLFIGSWAIEELSLKRDVTTNKKVTAFLLAMVPIGGISSFLQAARTAIRKDRVSNLSISAISSVMIMTILLFGTRDEISALSQGKSLDPKPEATIDPAVASLYPDPSLIPEATETKVPPTPTRRVYYGGCRNPNSVTADEEGDVLEVCGRVTNYGDIECDTCPLGFYSYIKLDHKFQIVSYDWRFTFAWLGDCMRVSDMVEMLGEKPVFVFGKGEGYAGTECITDAQGELVCDGGYYFQDYFGCSE